VAFHDLDSGGLAGAVGAEESEDLAAAHQEVNATYGLDRPVGLAEAAYMDGDVFHKSILDDAGAKSTVFL
jgi:hypothetical protein